MTSQSTPNFPLSNAPIKGQILGRLQFCVKQLCISNSNSPAQEDEAPEAADSRAIHHAKFDPALDEVIADLSGQRSSTKSHSLEISKGFNTRWVGSVILRDIVPKLAFWTLTRVDRMGMTHSEHHRAKRSHSTT